MPGIVNCRGTEEQRFWRKVAVNYDSAYDGNCWEWQAGLQSQGYGMFSLTTVIPNQTKIVLAHVWAFEYLIGPVPEGLELDHLCRNTRCVNPSHVEAVTHAINFLRGNHPTAINSRNNVCIRGHDLNSPTVYINPTNGARYCRECRKIREN